jgi:hypothetical protein
MEIRYQIVEVATVTPDALPKGLMLPDEDFTLAQVDNLLNSRPGTIKGVGTYGRFEVIESTLQQTADGQVQGRVRQ